MKPEILKSHISRAIEKEGIQARYKLVEWSLSNIREVSEEGIREYSGSPEEMIKIVKNIDILVVHTAPVTASVIEAGKSLKLICCTRGNPVNIDVNAAKKRGIPIVYTPGRNAEAVAEFTIGLIIALTRNIAIAHTSLKKEKIWKDELYCYDSSGPELKGRIIGVIGFGRVGLIVTEKAKALGMNVLVFDPYVKIENIVSAGANPVNLDTLLSNSDIVTIHARLTDETRGMIGARELSLMKKTAYLINTARGKIVDQKALYDALKNKLIAGAALDVFEHEPLSPDNPLLSLNNVILTPHIAGASRDTVHRAADMVAKDIVRFLKGEKLRYVYISS